MLSYEYLQSSSRLVLLSILISGCNFASTIGSSTPRAIEGRDFILFERVRLLDEMGFDQPVEAMSVLAPRGWKTQGGVRWKRISECRGEMVTFSMSSVSPDQSVRLDIYPARSFVWSDERTLNQENIAASRHGGCFVRQPVTAAEYLEKFAGTELGYALVSEIRIDEGLQATIDRINEATNAAARQDGTGRVQIGEAIYATLTWPDGTRGLANIGLSVAQKHARGRVAADGLALTTVFHQAVIRYRPEREAEALKLFGTVLASHRVNPVWQQAKDDFMARVGAVDDAGSVERLRLTGEASAAYAASHGHGAGEPLRDWERPSRASDVHQHRFIQTIREVETWQDASGSPVELGAGYTHGWSRPDGAYILTNSSLFDPAVEFKESWTRMQKAGR